MDTTIGDRLKIVRGKLLQEEFAKMMGVHKNTVAGYEKGISKPDAGYLLKIIERYPDVSAEWLLTGQEVIAQQIIAEFGANYSSAADLEHEYIMVPRYNVKVSAGGGSFIESEQVVDHLAFKSEWIRNVMRLNPGDLFLVNTVGDSMYPTIKEGDLLLVDKGQREVRDDAIYVLLNDGVLVAKRLQKLYDGSIQIKSDNKVYDAQLVPFDRVNVLNIIGRVVWGGGRM